MQSATYPFQENKIHNNNSVKYKKNKSIQWRWHLRILRVAAEFKGNQPKRSDRMQPTLPTNLDLPGVQSIEAILQDRMHLLAQFWQQVRI